MTRTPRTTSQAVKGALLEALNKDARTTSTRYHAIDGLRGLAAVLVIVHHCVLVSPEFFAAYKSEGEASPLVWALTNTPLHLAWAGSEAVFVFFILSGFVLTLPFLRATHPKWRVYYPKRLLRLYLPVWGSLVFALVMAWLVPRTENVENSPWINIHALGTTPIRDAILIFGTGVLNSPLWSLRWELLFSLLLPVYLFLAMRLRKFWLIWFASTLAVIGIASTIGEEKLIYLPMFGLGVLMAVHKSQLESWAQRLRSWSWACLIAACILLLTSKWMIPDVPALNSFAVLGGVLAMFLFLYFPPAIRFGEYSLLRWLGKISFSLYLIHEPIVVSVALRLETANPLLVLAISLPISLAVAELFFRFVEKPSHNMANTVGRVIQNRLARKASTQRI